MSCWYTSLYTPQPMQEGDTGVWRVPGGFTSLKRNAELRNPQSFIGASSKLPNLCPQGFTILDSENLFYALEWDTISVFQDCLLCKHPWHDDPEQKTGHTETERPMKNYFLSYINYWILTLKSYKRDLKMSI